jgi:hypothetical protein
VIVLILGIGLADDGTVVERPLTYCEEKHAGFHRMHLSMGEDFEKTGVDLLHVRCYVKSIKQQRIIRHGQIEIRTKKCQNTALQIITLTIHACAMAGNSERVCPVTNQAMWCHVIG